MDKTALATAAAATLAISTVGAESLPPPMGIMGPYDTPAMAADRINLPEDAGALAAQRGEAGLENASAAPPEDAGLLDLPLAEQGAGGPDLRELAHDDRDDKDEDKEPDAEDDQDDGDKDDGDKDDGDKDDKDKDDGDKDDKDKDDKDKDDGEDGDG
jgi:hypothetical protein